MSMPDIKEAPVRKYRRGVAYRTGDITKKQIIDEFGYADVVIDKRLYDEKEGQKLLNYTYDSLRDLASILNIPLRTLPLNSNSENIINIGAVNMTYNNLCPIKTGNIALNWYRILDRYLGNCVGKDSLIKNLNLLDSSVDIVRETQSLLHNLRYKINRNLNLVDKNNIYAILNRIDYMLEKMPVLKNEDDDNIDLIFNLEDYRFKFINTLERRDFNKMAQIFEENGLFFEKEKQEILECLDELDTLGYRETNQLFVDTEFYSNLKTKTDLTFLSEAFNCYIGNKLREVGNYNNFLVVDKEAEGIKFVDSESKFFNQAIASYLETVKKYLVESTVVYEESNVEVVENIDTILDEDKGKFKLTLFKKLAKDNGMNVEMGKTERTDEDIYNIVFNDCYIKNIYVPVYNNPLDKNHVISIYCGDKGEIKKEYVFDFELDYEDFVTFLANMLKDKQEDKKVIYFNPDIFVKYSNQKGLKVKGKNIDEAKNSVFVYFDDSVFTNIEIPYIKKSDIEDVEIRIKVALLGNKILSYTVSWKNLLRYEDLVMLLLRLREKIVQKVMTQKEIVEKERKSLLKQIERTTNAHNIDKLINTEFTTTKELRDILLKYLDYNRINLGYFVSFGPLYNMLQHNFANMGINFDIVLTTIPAKDLVNKSKNWCFDKKNNVLMMRSSPTVKQLEGLVESSAKLFMNTKNNQNKYRKLYSEGLTYMFCKYLKLDVRTYCIDSDFENLVKQSKELKKQYLKILFNLFGSYVDLFRDKGV